MLEPGKSRGYTAWNEITDATYKVEIYSSDSIGNLSLISTLETENNYIKLDPLLFTTPSISYRIFAISNLNNILDQSDIIYTLPPNYDNWVDDFCSKKCNGKTFAWGLTAYAKRVFDGSFEQNGQPSYEYGPVRLRLSGASDYEDPSNGIRVPYYQAVSNTVLTAMGNQHPYNTIKPNTNPAEHVYSRNKITPAISQTSGPFFDKNNSLVNDGFLIEKKMDQYTYMWDARTPETVDAGLGICDAGLQGQGSTWMNFFNVHTSTNDFAQMPVSVQPFATAVPVDLSCASGVYASGSGVEVDDWNDWYADVYHYMDSCENELAAGNEGNPFNKPDYEEMSKLFYDIVDINSPTNGSINNLIFNSIFDRKEFSINIDKRTNKVSINDNGNPITKGLYYLNSFSTDGKLIPNVFELKGGVEKPLLNSSVDFKILSNPLLQSKLKIEISSQVNTNAQLIVFNLNGVQVFSSSLVLKENQTDNLEINLSSFVFPYNQVRISLVFDDASVIQKTAFID